MVKLSIGHRLFIAILLAILGVAAAAVMVMRQNVTRSFTDYAVRIELERLGELSASLAGRHGVDGSWRFIPSARADSQAWIAREMGRLQSARGLPAPPPPPPPPVAPPAPPAGGLIAPPLPPPVIGPEPPHADHLGLQDRVTLFDAAGRYLAGRVPQPGDDSARRAIVRGGATIGYLAVAKGARPSDDMASVFLDQLRESLWAILAASVALSAAVAMVLAAHFRKPILQLADGARHLAQGRYDTRLKVARSDELGALASSFNQLADKLGQLESSRRQWVADTSHELRTPLAVLRAQLEALQDGVRQGGAAHTEAMLRQVLALNRLIDQLYTLARSDVGELDCHRTPVDPWQLACSHAQAFADRFAAASINVRTEGEAPARAIAIDEDQIRQVLTNLFENCIRYCGPGSQVVMSVCCTAGKVELIIDDDGPGVPEAALAQLGERFYRVDASRSREHGGAGLGLSLSRRIAVAHGGALAFARSPLGGLQVRLSLADA